MIIVRLKGGMGNQLFQYALGRALSVDWKMPFKIDKSFYKTYTLHDYVLANFNLVENIVTTQDLSLAKKFNRGNLFSELFVWLEERKPITTRYFIREHDLSFNPNIAMIKNNVYLDGFWQSEKYFENIKQIIQKEFSPRIKLDKKNNDLKKIIQSKKSVSIHIRRGNYVTDKETLKKHGVCSKEYYFDAINLLSSKIGNFHIFVFSDDNQWARRNISFGYPTTFIDFNGRAKDYADLTLMSMCQHNIIANSTFSWWGGWLNTNPNKIVIAPKKWFRDLSMNTNDLLPNGWIKI